MADKNVIWRINGGLAIMLKSNPICKHPDNYRDQSLTSQTQPILHVRDVKELSKPMHSETLQEI
jgi:hypothetical protein